MLSCSNDTTIKLWKLRDDDGASVPPPEQAQHLLSFHTFDVHTDYVRAMAISKQKGILFSVSDDGCFLMADLNEGKIVEEYKAVQSYPSTVPALA